MAERRMFAKSIVLSDAFLDMPLSARCLYFTLGMLADDDGFIGNPKSIMRQCGSSQDDMLALLQKRYILAFDSGVIVIKHWRMNNYLQSDRHKSTTYLEELNTLMIDEKGAYTEKEKAMYTNCIQNVYTDKDRLGKESIDKDSVDKESIGYASDDAKPKPQKHKFGEFQKVLLTDDEYNRLAEDFGVDVRNDAIRFLDEYIEEKGYKSKSHNLAIRRWVVSAVKEKKQSKRNSNVIDWDNV